MVLVLAMHTQKKKEKRKTAKIERIFKGPTSCLSHYACRTPACLPGRRIPLHGFHFHVPFPFHALCTAYRLHRRGIPAGACRPGSHALRGAACRRRYPCTPMGLGFPGFLSGCLGPRPTSCCHGCSACSSVCPGCLRGLPFLLSCQCLDDHSCLAVNLG